MACSDVAPAGLVLRSRARAWAERWKFFTLTIACGKGKKTVEVVHIITSDADAATLAAWIQGHWHIENKLHWIRDVTYQEEKSDACYPGRREYFRAAV